MNLKPGYLIIDIGTGNVRVALTNDENQILAVESDIVHYESDSKYKSALYFDPNLLWEQIEVLTIKLLKENSEIEIIAITASSQREGVVLIDEEGNSLLGLPNHDHRGREWEDSISHKDFIYQSAGRYPSSLFSALKLIGVKKRLPKIYSEFSKLLSISDWAQYKLSGIIGYEHSQASETLLYDVKEKQWSSKLCSIFEIDEKVLPKLHLSGEILGPITPFCSRKLGVSLSAVIVVGGADTQLAIKSTLPLIGDVVIVSGTTTPIVKLLADYQVDENSRTWTNGHIESKQFVLEANAGVTGLNYQRLKEIFYPNESYKLIEEELRMVWPSQCVASLGSLIAEEDTPVIKGGFIFDVPVSHQLTRASFVWAILWDIACCIKENFDVLCEVSNYEKDFVWACGGGFQSQTFRQFIASLLNKKVYIREGYRQASVVGGAFVCSQALTGLKVVDEKFEIIHPKDRELYLSLYKEWKSVRVGLKKMI